VKTASGILTRPLQRLYSLEVRKVEEIVQEEVTEDEKKSPDDSMVTRFGRRVVKPQRLGIN
jgi:phosphopantothenoylcysteine synthetase/decarboxylase